jgi:hypothetical protein
MSSMFWIASKIKVFWFFSSEKNRFLKPLFLLTYFSDGLSGKIGAGDTAAVALLERSVFKRLRAPTLDREYVDKVGFASARLGCNQGDKSDLLCYRVGALTSRRLL